MALDIDRLLADVSPDEPCGDDLSYDPDYYAVFNAAQGTPPREEMAGQAVEGEEPSWPDIRRQCTDLLKRTKDLNVVMLLIAASTATDGVPGLADGLGVLKGLLGQHWEGFHPRLDPDDGNDPLERVNLLAGFAATPGSDWNPANIQRCLRRATLARSKQLGQFCLRDVMVASGELSPAKGETPAKMDLIAAAFQDTDPVQLRATADATAACQVISKEIDEWITQKIGASKSADLGPWHAVLKDLFAQLSKFVVVEQAPESPASNAVATQSTGATTAVAPAPPAALSGSITSRDDVMKALNKIIEYYQKHEPASPLPILLHRAARLVPMGFADVIRELAPAAMDQIKLISGADPFLASKDAKPAPVRSVAATDGESEAPAGDAPPPPNPPSGGWKPVRL